MSPLCRQANRGLALVLSWTLAVATGLGCGAASFVELGEQERPAAGRVRASDLLDLETVAWPAPLLSAQPPDVLAGAAVPLTVVSHEPTRAAYRLVLAPETGEPLRLEYRLGLNERLPVEVGEALLWRLPLDDQLEPTGLLVREPDGALRALVIVGETLGSLAPDLGPLGVAPDFSAASLIYSETTAAMSCIVGVDHHALKVSDGRDTVWVRPGTGRLIELTSVRAEPRVRLSAHDGAEVDASPFELLVFDVARASTSSADPRCPQRAHVSWALLSATSATSSTSSTSSSTAPEAP